MWIAAVESLTAMLVGLLLISFGAFFTHTLAYGWVGQNATRAKATATALYLVHYYVGGSLGGFLLLYCWQHGGWSSVLMGGKRRLHSDVCCDCVFETHRRKKAY